MRLEKISYVEYEGQAQEWSINQLELGAKNLLVGRNATGKSRSLNIIWALAQCLAGIRGLMPSGKYECEFSDDGREVSYSLAMRDGVVLTERLSIAGEVLLRRSEDHTGQIRAIELGRDMQFQTPSNVLSVLVRRDTIQHPFLELLFGWASTVRYYPFGTHLGKDVLTIMIPNGPEPDERESFNATAIFKKGVKLYGQPFIDAVIADMAHVNYPIETLKLDSPLTFSVDASHGNAICLVAQERGLPGWTDQFSMSQGMFRVLAIAIQVNYIRFANSSGLIVIDDIGEGLDFERSCSLVNMLRQRADELAIQIVMATNDRFIMNAVPLQEWSVLRRDGNRVSVRNMRNSQDVFEAFRFTGLSNFSFFELDYLENIEGLEA